MEKVGIDCIATYIPKLFVDLTGEWAEVRAKELNAESVEKLKGKIIKGIGVRKMSIADFHEDAATMSAMAVKSLLKENNIDLNDVSSITVGTETTVDQSKSMSAYVLGMLEDWKGHKYSHIGCPQVQFACIGATYGLEASLNALLANTLEKKYAIVVATDIAKYALRSPGEYTQGAGAVAMLLSHNPRLVEIDPSQAGTATFNERDFFRPNYSKTAVVDGKYSIDVYLDCIEKALDNSVKRSGKSMDESYSSVDHFLFHVPFPRMAEYAAARIFGRMWPHVEAFSDTSSELGLSEDYSLMTSDEKKGLERDLIKTPAFEKEFAEKIEPSLELSRETGNIYSGSLYLALASLFNESNRKGLNLSNKTILFSSYGSGASAKVFPGKISPRYKEVFSTDNMGAQLEDRKEGGLRFEISLDDYHRIHSHVEAKIVAASDERLCFGSDNLSAQAPLESQQTLIELSSPPESILPPCGEFILERIGTENSREKVDIGYRYYKWVD